MNQSKNRPACVWKQGKIKIRRQQKKKQMLLALPGAVYRRKAVQTDCRGQGVRMAGSNEQDTDIWKNARQHYCKMLGSIEQNKDICVKYRAASLLAGITFARR
eukprot:1161392-Pelagomonas_calceolata.AAC.25